MTTPATAATAPAATDAAGPVLVPEIEVTTDVTKGLVPHEFTEPAGVAASRAWLMRPSSFDEAMRFAEMMADSAFVPKEYIHRPGDVFCAVQYGAELGLPPLQALQGIAVINGKPSVWGDAALAVVIAARNVEDLKEWFEGNGDTLVAKFWAKRAGRPTPIEQSFSVTDAKTAKLWGKGGPWTTNPKRMLQMRARAFGLRDGWADSLKGMAIREEVEDYAVTATPPAPEKTIATPEATKRETKKTGAATPPAGSATGSGVDVDPLMIDQPQRRRLFGRLKEAGHNEEGFRAWLQLQYGIESGRKIPRTHYDVMLRRVSHTSPLVVDGFAMAVPGIDDDASLRQLGLLPPLPADAAAPTTAPATREPGSDDGDPADDFKE